MDARELVKKLQEVIDSVSEDTQITCFTGLLRKIPISGIQVETQTFNINKLESTTKKRINLCFSVDMGQL